MDDPEPLARALGFAAIVVYALGLLAMLAILGTLAWRRLQGVRAAELFPERSIPSAAVIALLCVCFPVPFLAWLPLWSLAVRRGNGTRWSVPWKVAYTVAPFVPIVAAAAILARSHMGGGQTGLSLLAPMFVLLVTVVDAVVHRRP